MSLTEISVKICNHVKKQMKGSIENNAIILHVMLPSSISDERATKPILTSNWSAMIFPHYEHINPVYVFV